MSSSGGGNDDAAHAKKHNKKRQGTTKLGMTCTKDGSFGDWYSEVIVHGEMIGYYTVSGCYILLPSTMQIWELLKNFFDGEMRRLKAQLYYFPLFVTEAALQKEKDHIAGFAPEVAWVTRSGESSDLEAPIAVRPTSETIMYPFFSKWIRSYRDLPFRCYQWCNVVRWEFSDPTPFIRSREFLWQEGHSAFATRAEADEEVLHVLELYRRIYEEFLAVPVITGRKSEMEKFAGALYTTTVEAFVPNTGRGIQAATSHCLGQNFADMFGIKFEDDKGFRSNVWQNSWGYSTRSIGVMAMTHGDDKGLVMPPRVAPLQVIVIPVLYYKDADMMAALKEACESTVHNLGQSGMRAEFDDRQNRNPGWKYSHWEMKGVPLRIEIGPRDLEKKQVCMVRRDNGAKVDVPVANLVEKVRVLLDGIQDNLFRAATERRDDCIRVVRTWDEFIAALNDKRLILAPWCDEEEVEKDVKSRTKGEGELGAAKTLCTPFDQPELPEGTLCFASGKPAKVWSFWGRSY